MSETFHYSTTYVLDKAQFSETYDQSVTILEPKKAYQKAVIVALLGLFLLYFTEVSGYIAWFLIALGGVEAMGVRFQKAWWLARQMISKAANSELTLTLDEEGVASKSHYVNRRILWQEMSKIEATEKGWLLYSPKGKTYLSNQNLSAEAQAFVSQQAKIIEA